MQTVTTFSELAQHLDGRRTAATIGVFDGVHLGHQALIGRTVELARSSESLALAITFANHPLSVLAPPYNPRRLITAEAKAELLGEAGIDVVLMLEFSAELAATPPQEFVLRDLVKLAGVRHLVCGYDFSFGARGAGDVDMLRPLGAEHDFSVHCEEPVVAGNSIVKSTRIRDLLSTGNVKDAAELLTRPHQVPGVVVSGFQRGRQIGFPTANLQPPEHYQWPALGVYVCGARIEKEDRFWPAMVNIGTSPTFGNESTSMEAHLLEFSGELEGKNMTLFFLDRLRDEQKFSGVDALVEQLNEDRRQTMERWQNLALMLP